MTMWRNRQSNHLLPPRPCMISIPTSDSRHKCEELISALSTVAGLLQNCKISVINGNVVLAKAVKLDDDEAALK